MIILAENIDFWSHITWLHNHNIWLKKCFCLLVVQLHRFLWNFEDLIWLLMCCYQIQDLIHSTESVRRRLMEIESFYFGNLIYFMLYISKLCNLLHCTDKYWWNMPFKETKHGDGDVRWARLLLCCNNSENTQCNYDVTWFEYTLWCHTMHEWVMNIHYQNWIIQGQFTNVIRNPSK